MKLLLVDDNAAVRRLIKNVVETITKDVCECADGAAALEAYRTYQPDFVLISK